MLPKSLRTWFVFHFIVDIFAAFLLIFYPQTILDFFGFQSDFISLRLIGAALIGIGGTSWLMHKQGRKIYSSMLNLKILWSVSAILVLLFSEPILWSIIFIFIIFLGVWIYYKKSYNL
jgi:Na+/melibiose symporter-like transporter